MYGIEKDDTEGPIRRAAGEMQTQGTDLWTWGGGGAVNSDSSIETNALSYVK